MICVVTSENKDMLGDRNRPVIQIAKSGLKNRANGHAAFLRMFQEAKKLFSHPIGIIPAGETAEKGDDEVLEVLL